MCAQQYRAGAWGELKTLKVGTTVENIQAFYGERFHYKED
jgi:hypothetical protein